MNWWWVPLNEWLGLDSDQKDELVAEIVARGYRLALEINPRERNPRLGEFEEYEDEALQRHTDHRGFNPPRRHAGGGV